jgi:hypothetical protein
MEDIKMYDYFNRLLEKGDKIIYLTSSYASSPYITKYPTTVLGFTKHFGKPAAIISENDKKIAGTWFMIIEKHSGEKLEMI